jgi:hypothetical protein
MTIQARVISRFDMTLKFNGMNNGYGYFLTGTNTPLDQMFLGLNRNDVELSIAETNMNRRNLNLPEIAYTFAK